MKLLLTLLALGFFANVAGKSLAQTAYTLTDIGQMHSTSNYSQPVAINNSSQVVGIENVATSVNRSWVWQAGTLTDLGILGTSFNTVNYGSTMVKGINSSGQIIGYSEISHGPNIYHAFLYSSGALSDLTPTATAGDTTVAVAINDAATIVGNWSGSSNYNWILKNSILSNISLSGHSHDQIVSLGANDQIYGTNNIDNGYEVFLQSGLIRTDVFGPSSRYSVGMNGINCLGQITSFAQDNTYTDHAYIWRPLIPNTVNTGRQREILAPSTGTSPSPSCVNEWGECVGNYVVTATGQPAAFVNIGSTSVDLGSLISGTSGWTLETAVGINSKGQIVGTGHFTDGLGHVQHHTYLLTPLN